MLIEKKYVLHKICSLTLPSFAPEETDNDSKSLERANRMNDFYDKLREEIISYTENSDNIRRYAATFDYDLQDDDITIRLTLTARINSDDGRIVSAKKNLSQKWEKGLLCEFKELI